MAWREILQQRLSLLRQVFRQRDAAVLFVLGFASGLPLLLTRGTLQAWLTDEKVNIKTIGLFSLVALPYSLKFLWAPLLDRFAFPWLGRRRGWLAISQILLVLVIALMGSINPVSALSALALLCVLLSFFSASQDIVTDGYRADLLTEETRARGTATFLVGYRLALLIAGSLTLLLADYFTKSLGWKTTESWRVIYWIMAVSMGVGIIASIAASEPFVKQHPKSLAEAVVKPFKDFFTRKGSIFLLFFIALYNLSDTLLSLTTTFYLSLGFSKTELATLNKLVGFFATIVGYSLGGLVLARLKSKRALFVGGIAMALSNLCYLWLSVACETHTFTMPVVYEKTTWHWQQAATTDGVTVPMLVMADAGKMYTSVLVSKTQSYFALVVSICVENISSGLSQTAFLAFLLGLCNKAYSVTQYALLTSASSVIGRFLGGTSGILVEQYGWEGFFLITVIAGAPGLLLLLLLPKSTFEALDTEKAAERNEGVA